MVFQGQTPFWPYLRNCMVRLTWNEKDVHRLDTGYNMWPWPLTSLVSRETAFNVSRLNFETALSPWSQELLVWNKKDVNHPFMTMILSIVTIVGWADVPYSDWGDFRHRRAVDIRYLVFYLRPVLASGYCHLLCLCVCINHLLVRTITRHPFKLRSPNLVQRSKTRWLRSLLFLGAGDRDLQGQI